MGWGRKTGRVSEDGPKAPSVTRPRGPAHGGSFPCLGEAFSQRQALARTTGDGQTGRGDTATCQRVCSPDE